MAVDVPPGSFYLGSHTEGSGQPAGSPVLYRSDHLTTHGVIVGMTGSGKTGLGIGLVEEALLAGIPVLAIDPKGDLGNLKLLFPDFAPADFEPWVSTEVARQDGRTVAEVAAETAAAWRDGLAGAGIEAERVRRLRDGHPVTIYTPGSTSGTPLDVVGSLDAPASVSDVESTRDEIEGYVTGLLALVDVDADPLSSREHILLSNLIEHSWTAGRSLDLAALVAQVVDPPLRKLGVFEIEQFFPAADRTKLAMRLNGVIASPSFAAWTEGPDLDIDRLVRGPGGEAAAAVVTLSHLSDTERQFVVTLVLSKLISWMRRQPGSSDLRLLVYMDEVFGFLPPTAEPPSKKPLLTLLKQARAFGVGVVLSTQNPVDLDYKALSNAGTWMIGRLQTERDKGRLMDGLVAADGSVDVASLTTTISSLPKRTFVLHETRASAPQIFSTRWAMSYLAGPLTRDQIARLTPAVQPRPAPPDPAIAAPSTGSEPIAAPEVEVATDESPVMPKVADGVTVRHVDAAAPWASELGAVAGGQRLVPALAARVSLLFDDDKAGLRHVEEYECVLFPLLSDPDVAMATAVDYDERDLRAEAPPGARYVLSSARIDTKALFSGFERDLKDHLHRSRTTTLLHNPALKLYGRPGEDEVSFAERCRAAGDQAADDAAAKLRERFESKINRTNQAIARAEDRLRELETAAQGRQTEELLSGAGALLGTFLGGRKGARDLAGRLAGKLGGATGRRTRSSQSRERLTTAENRLQQELAELDELEAELADALVAITEECDAKATEVETLVVPLEKNDIAVTEVVLAWVPTE